jgi:alpha-glucosidase
MADFGYDVADYADVDPLFGDLDAFDALLADAHGRGLRVLLDWVPNHTSDRTRGSSRAAPARDSPKRTGTAGATATPDRPPNNWRARFGGGPRGRGTRRTEQWYLHTFLPEQPDLNWDEPEVVAAMHDVLRFWLDRGVDGFRADVVHLIGKDPALPTSRRAGRRGHLTVVGAHDYAAPTSSCAACARVLDEYPASA